MAEGGNFADGQGDGLLPLLLTNVSGSQKETMEVITRSHAFVIHRNGLRISVLQDLNEGSEKLGTPSRNCWT